MKAIATILIAALSLAGCGGGGVEGAVVVADPTLVIATPVVATPAIAVAPLNETLRHPTISGLEFVNSATGVSSLTSASGDYFGYSGDLVTFTLGDIVLFTMPGDLVQPVSSLYDASLYSTSVLYSSTAVENLMAFLMAIDDDGNYNNGIQIAGPVRSAARGLSINFNQTAIDFRLDPAVQYATAVLSANTLFGQRVLPSPADALVALHTS
jgi:hypothetical protein